MTRLIKYALAPLFVIWAAGSADRTLAFDVCAYWDPQTYAKVHSWNGGFNFFDCDSDSVETPMEKAAALAQVLPFEEPVLDLYDDMGLTILQAFVEDSAQIYERFANHDFQVINDWWYWKRIRYPEAQDRTIFPADSPNPYVIYDANRRTLQEPYSREFPQRHLLQVPRSPEVIARCDASRVSAMCPAYKRAGGTCCRCPNPKTSLCAVMRHAPAQCAPLTSEPAAFN